MKSAKFPPKIKFTYKLTPEDRGFSVFCLDWPCVFTEGENLKECKKNAKEATKLMLRDLVDGTLHNLDYPQIKARKKQLGTFTLTFDLKN